MVNGHFYFIKDEFYEALPDCNLMTNKGVDLNGKHGRPCHYCFKYEGYFWMIPISHKVDKFERIYHDKMNKRGRCDGIRFGFVNGQKRAFLIQNAFPVTERYIDEEYRINHNTTPVTVSENLEKELNALMRKVVRLYKKGINMPLTNLFKIVEFLEK